MSNSVFLIVLIALGFAMLAYFNRRSKNFRRRHPGEEDPVEHWWTGRDEDDRPGRKDDRRPPSDD